MAYPSIRDGVFYWKIFHMAFRGAYCPFIIIKPTELEWIAAVSVRTRSRRPIRREGRGYEGTMERQDETKQHRRIESDIESSELYHPKYGKLRQHLALSIGLRTSFVKHLVNRQHKFKGQGSHRNVRDSDPLFLGFSLKINY